MCVRARARARVCVCVCVCVLFLFSGLSCIKIKTDATVVVYFIVLI